VTCTETAKEIRLYQLELASQNRDYEVKDIVAMHSIVKKYNLKNEEKERLQQVESNYGYKQPRDKNGNIELTLQLTHKWGEHDYEKKLIQTQKNSKFPISLAVQVDSKDIKLTKEQEKKLVKEKTLNIKLTKKDEEKRAKEKTFQEIKKQLESQNLSDIWTLDNSIGNILTPRGNTPFNGWLIQNPIEFPDIAVLIWQKKDNNVLKLNIYTILFPNHLIEKETKDITNEALCIKNQEDPSIDSFIGSVIGLAHQSIEEIFHDDIDVGY